jgi:hypothetical protein
VYFVYHNTKAYSSIGAKVHNGVQVLLNHHIDLTTLYSTKKTFFRLHKNIFFMRRKLVLRELKSNQFNVAIMEKKSK